MGKIVTSIIFFALGLLTVSCGKTPQLGKSDIKQVVEAMTLEEKVRMVVGTCTTQAMPPEAAPGLHNRENYPGGENTIQTQNKVPGAAGYSYAIPRLGIPSIVFADGPAGLRINPTREGDDNTYYCTAFPTATLLASTWDPSIIEKVGTAIGEEVREYGVDILLAPGMNIQRNPLTGRNFEYFSEDPFLAGCIAAAYVKGVQSQGVGTTVKHFAVNNQELYRNGIDVVVSERTLMEIYLRGFQKVVKEASPWTVMSSYNKINGTYASENGWLLSDVLRDEWGFDGFVMTDWWGADDPVVQMQAGNDLLMPGTPNQIEEIRQAVKDGKLDESILDRNVENVLRVILRTPAMTGTKTGNTSDLDAHSAISREIATEGMILLKNSGVLPLTKEQKVALFGNYSYDTQVGGSGSGYVNRKLKINLDKGLAGQGFTIDPDLSREYTAHIAREKAKLPAEYFWYVPTTPEMLVPDAMIDSAALKNDIAIITLGRMSGEGSDRNPGEGDYKLSDIEKSLVSKVCNAFHFARKPVVAVLNIGAPVEMSGWGALPDAILLSWLPGQEAGNAIADILDGRVSPSGKLPVTLAKKYEDIPSSANFGVSKGEINKVRYDEGLMVGYRYFCTAGVEPEYPFGFGLSYTTFEYEGLKIDPGLTLSVKVRNTGGYSGKEIVQIYVAKPCAGAGRPARELCAYAKTKLLAPGEEQLLIIPVSKDDLRCFEGGCWMFPKGEYSFFAAASSSDMRGDVTISLQ